MPLFGLMDAVAFYSFIKVVRSFFISWSLSIFLYLIASYGFSLIFFSMYYKQININKLAIFSVAFSSANSLSLNIFLSKLGFFNTGEFFLFPLIVSVITIASTLFWLVMFLIVLFHKKKKPIPEE